MEEQVSNPYSTMLPETEARKKLVAMAKKGLVKKSKFDELMKADEVIFDLIGPEGSTWA